MPWRAVQPRRSMLCERHPRDAVTVHFLFPHIRVELLLRTMLTRQWDDDAWPLVRQEIQKALALRNRLRKAGWWN